MQIKKKIMRLIVLECIFVIIDPVMAAMIF